MCKFIDVWSIDFMSDSLADGRRFRILIIIDDYTRESPGILVARSIPSGGVTAFIDRIALSPGYPRGIRVNNGPEFTSATFHRWAEEQHITIEHTRPGKPSENAFIESFNGKIRDECLNENWFLTISDAQTRIEQWRNTYNEERPHGSLNNLTSYEFIKEHDMKLITQELNLHVSHIMG
ncbi:MAG: transposase [Syntrophobacterales bacterium]|nr:MAG: transposase [Syntrophobacterales bacterium]